MTVSDSGSNRHRDRMKNSPNPTTRTSDAARSLCWRSQPRLRDQLGLVPLDHPMVGGETVDPE